MTRILLAAALALGLSVAQSAAGQDRPPPPGADHGQASARDAVKDGRQAPLARVLATIAKRYPGRQLDTTMGEAGGKPVYLVKWQLAGGQIRVFTVDAQSGELLN